MNVARTMSSTPEGQTDGQDLDSRDEDPDDESAFGLRKIAGIAMCCLVALVAPVLLWITVTHGSRPVIPAGTSEAVAQQPVTNSVAPPATVKPKRRTRPRPAVLKAPPKPTHKPAVAVPVQTETQYTSPPNTAAPAPPAPVVSAPPVTTPVTTRVVTPSTTGIEVPVTPTTTGIAVPYNP